MHQKVDCYSGYKFGEHPKAFTWCEQDYDILKIQQSWKTPQGTTFRVETTSGQFFELHYNESEDSWSINPT